MVEPPAAAFRRVLFHGALRPELATWLAADGIRPEPFREHAWTLASDELGLVLGGADLAPALAIPPPPGSARRPTASGCCSSATRSPGSTRSGRRALCSRSPRTLSSRIG